MKSVMIHSDNTVTITGDNGSMVKMSKPTGTNEVTLLIDKDKSPSVSTSLLKIVISPDSLLVSEQI